MTCRVIYFEIHQPFTPTVARLVELQKSLEREDWAIQQFKQELRWLSEAREKLISRS